jgi:hypothetical protein
MNSQQPTNNTEKIIKRLILVKGLISLEEEEAIFDQLEKLSKFENEPEVARIYSLIKNQEYGKATVLIEEYINRFNQITKFIDPEIEALRFEAKTLERQIQSLSNEKSELDKIIHEFSVRHTRELGELLLKLLEYRKEKLQGTSDYHEAEKDYNEFHKNYETSKIEKISKLSESELIEIKEIYRKATKLCHPDIVEEEQREKAHEIFIELKEAYENNNLDRVKEIYNGLLKNEIFSSKSDTTDEKSILQDEINRLRTRLSELKAEISTIKESDAYLTISNIENWDKYFSETKKQLQAQLYELEHE